MTLTRSHLILLLAAMSIVGVILASLSWFGDGSPITRQTVAHEQSVTGIVQEVHEDSVTVREGTKLRTYEFDTGTIDAETTSKLRLADQMQLETRVFYTEQDGELVLERIEPTVPDGLKTFGDMKYGDLPAYPPVQDLPAGMRLEDVPITNVKVWDARSMALLHASTIGDASPEELAKLAPPTGMDPSAAEVTLDDLKTVERGDSRAKVIGSLGEPGHTFYHVRQRQTCEYWPRKDDPMLMSGVCFDEADIAVKMIAKEHRVGAQLPVSKDAPRRSSSTQTPHTDTQTHTTKRGGGAP